MEGEIKKLRFKPKTLDNTIVKDGLQAVSILNEKEPYYLVGGIATQSYLPSKCRRPTSDIDFSILRPLNYEDFKQVIAPVDEYLRDSGYKGEVRKGPRSYCLDIETLSGESICLEFARRNDNCFGRNKERLEREFHNANMKIVEGRDSRYRVAKPEDIAVPKLVRSVGALKRNSNLKEFIPRVAHIKPLSDDYIKEQLSAIEDLRNLSMENIQDSLLFDRLRFTSDIYDVRMLSETTGFNEDYWNKTIEGFDKTFAHGDGILLARSILPFNSKN